MPLLDHFHPPLSLHRLWHAFHHSWATYLSADFNRQLPEGYFAAPNVQFSIEIDVATFDEEAHESSDGASDWLPDAPALTLPLALITDMVEVQVFSTSGGPTLAGAVELISPSNKDRVSHRDAFVSKCATYIQSGLGLVMVDVVTDRHADLHGALLTRLGSPGAGLCDANLYATAYHPVRRGEKPELDVWQEQLQIGQLLPTLPLWLRDGPCLAVRLEATYARTREEQRVGSNGATPVSTST